MEVASITGDKTPAMLRRHTHFTAEKLTAVKRRKLQSLRQ